MTAEPMQPFWVVVDSATGETLEKISQTEVPHFQRAYSKEIAAGTHRIVGPFTEADVGASQRVAELEASLRRAIFDFETIKTLNSHGASDRTYIDWLRNAARDGEERASAAISCKTREESQ
jgi:hypothetical protein